MLRAFASLTVGLMLLVGGSLAAADKDVGKAGAKEMQGKIVSVDPQKGVVVIRNAAGKEQQYTVGQGAKVFGADNKALLEGLRSNQLRAGQDVRFRTGTGNSISELHLGPAAGGAGGGGAAGVNKRGG